LYIKIFKLLSTNQRGFKKFHSITDCNVKFETEILESFASKQIMILISSDLQKAYDTRLLNSLKKIHCFPPTFCSVIRPISDLMATSISKIVVFWLKNNPKRLKNSYYIQTKQRFGVVYKLVHISLKIRLART